MGTPIPSKAVEMAVKNCIDPNKIEIRQMTPEERERYDSIGKPSKRIVAYNYPDVTLFSEERKADQEMRGDKIPIPNKQWILEQCSKHKNKTQAIRAIAEAKSASVSVVFSWFKDLGIEYDFISNLSIASREEIEPGGEVDIDSAKVNDETIINTTQSSSDQQTEDFILLNKMYRFGNLEVDIQFDKQRVVIVDNGDESGNEYGEVSLPFEKVKQFAHNLFGIGVNLVNKEEK